MSFSYEDILSSPAFHKAAVKKVARYIENRHPKVEVLACRGSSGAAVAYPVAYILGLEVCHVRKDGERSHSDHRVGNNPDGRSYVIVDDFSATGNTLKDIICECGPKTCAGIVLYMEHSSRNTTFAYMTPQVFGGALPGLYEIPSYWFSRFDYKIKP